MACTADTGNFVMDQVAADSVGEIEGEGKMINAAREFLSFARADLSKFDVDAAGNDYIAKAKVRTDGRFFVLADDGEWMVIVPVMEDGEIDDLLAFHPSSPEKWYRRYDGPAFLGGDCLVAASVPPILHPHPLAWLQHGGDGIVVLNWSAARPVLRCHDKLIVLDPAYLTVVAERMMEPPRVPEIVCERTEA